MPDENLETSRQAGSPRTDCSQSGFTAAFQAGRIQWNVSLELARAGFTYEWKLRELRPKRRYQVGGAPGLAHRCSTGAGYGLQTPVGVVRTRPSRKETAGKEMAHTVMEKPAPYWYVPDTTVPCLCSNPLKLLCSTCYTAEERGALTALSGALGTRWGSGEIAQNYLLSVLLSQVF